MKLCTCFVAFATLWTSFVFCLVDAYISPAPHGAWDPNQHLQRKQHQPHDDPSATTNSQDSTYMADPAANVQVEDIFRAEYRDWGARYGKKIDLDNMERFENFKLNFMLQMQHNKKTGIFYLLNEYGDMTSQEYNQLMTTKDSKKQKTQASVRPPASRSGQRAPGKGWTPAKDGDELSGVDVVEALAKTAQEYQNFLTRKSASQRRRNSSSQSRHPSTARPKPKSPTGGEPVTHHQSECQQFMDGYNTPPRVSSPTEDIENDEPKTENPSNGYSVIAELVVDHPRQEGQEDVAFYESTAPRVNPPPKVQAMGANPHGQVGQDHRSRPGTLESKFFNAVKGKPSNKSFFTGIGTQVVGVSSNKRLVRWEPGMDEWA